MVATRVAATFFVIALHRVGQPASEQSCPPLARCGQQKAEAIARKRKRCGLPMCVLRWPATARYRAPAMSSMRLCKLQWQAAVQTMPWCDARAPRCTDDVQAISSFIAPPRVRTPPAHCLPLWLALTEDSVANQAAHGDGQISAQAQGHCTQRSCIRPRCGARHRPGDGVCHSFEACANSAVRSGRACAR